MKFSESIVEDAALAWLEALGYAVLLGPDIAAGMLGAESACACTHTDRRSEPLACGKMLTDIDNCLQPEAVA